jgi:hypothetical protein
VDPGDLMFWFKRKPKTGLQLTAHSLGLISANNKDKVEGRKKAYEEMLALEVEKVIKACEERAKQGYYNASIRTYMADEIKDALKERGFRVVSTSTVRIWLEW